MSTEIGEAVQFRVGAWLPSDQEVLDNWLAQLIKEVEAEVKPLHPVIEEFKSLIENDAEIYMFFNQMFEQVLAA